MVGRTAGIQFGRTGRGWKMVGGGSGGVEGAVKSRTALDGPGHRQNVYPRPPGGRPVCRRYRLGNNKGVFDAELYALYQAAKIFDEGNEHDQAYTILSDSTAAFERAKSDEMGPG